MVDPLSGFGLLQTMPFRAVTTTRKNAQNYFAAKQKRSDHDIFCTGDKVRVRDIAKGSSPKTGTIIDVICSQDGVIRTYLVEMEDGARLYRHQTYIRHILQENY